MYKAKPTHFLYLVVGESGSGKDTVVDALCARHGYRKVISHTTRPKRPNEADTTHVFVSDEEFEELRNEMVSTTVFDGYKYGATKDCVNSSDYYIIDPNGLASINRRCVEGCSVVIYLYTPEHIRKERMITRGESLEDIERRLEHDRQAFKDFHYDMRVANTRSLQETVNEMLNVRRICEEVERDKWLRNAGYMNQHPVLYEWE